MATQHGYGNITGTDSLVFAYDTIDTTNSYKGEPTVNYVPGTYGYSLYAYASGPVDTVVLNEKNQSTTVKRYTITNAINTARAAIFPSGLTTGVAYTFSFKWRYNGSTTASPSVGIGASKGNPEGGVNNNSFTSQIVNTVNLGNGWYLSTYTFIFSSVPTGKCMLTFGIVTGSTAGYVGETFDIYEAQFEIKNHKTQYSIGTRSTTQSLLDLTGTTGVDLANVSFDSNAQMILDGTDDYVNLGDVPAWDFGQNGTLEMMVRPINSTGNNRLWCIDNNSNNLDAYLDGSGYNVYMHGGRLGTTTPLIQNQWNHLAVTYTAGTIQIYINGIAGSMSGNTTGYNITNPSENNRNLYIGCYRDLRYNLNGSINVFKVYNRGLSQVEVLQNFKKYQTRFGIA
jgi:hypothetical protein